MRNGIQLVFSTLPLHPSDRPYPAHFLKYREISDPLMTSDTMVHRYGRSLITVITHFNKRQIQAAIATEPSLFPDPAWHCCLTQPISPWLKKKGLFFLHAGCVADKNQGILIIGHSRAGKSTLTLSAIKAGFKFLGDEQPILSSQNEHLQVYPFPRRIRLNRSETKIFPELHSLLKASPFERLLFHAEDIWPECTGVLCNPKLLIFPRFRSHGRLRLTRIHPSAALAILLQDDHFIWYQDGPWGPISRQHLNLFERLVLQTKAFELDYCTKDILRIPSVFRELLHA